MSKRLTAALAAATLCMLGSAQAQAQTTDYQSTPSDNPRMMPADVIPQQQVPPPAASTVRETEPAVRSEVQAETLDAMRTNQIPHGELSTPEQDKGAERALTPLERAPAP